MKDILGFNDSLDIVNDNIEKIQFDSKPASLFEPISYILSLGGKRVRPALVLMGYSLYRSDYQKALPACLAVEIFHNFTLLHDDLMDKADMRRGKQCVHVKWNDNTAILSGDAMLIEAYKEITKVTSNHLSASLSIFSKMATEICCGQQMDMEFENRLDVAIEEYMEMINLKTAVLLGASLQLGALLAGATESDMKHLYEFGRNLGLAFQLMDDLLDVYGDPISFGKKIGGDILCNKKTFLLISALKNKSERENLIHWIGIKDFNETEKIKSVTEIYNKLNIKQITKDAIHHYFEKATEALNNVQLPVDKKQDLYKLAESLNKREV